MGSLIHFPTFFILRFEILQFKQVLSVFFTNSDSIICDFNPNTRILLTFINSEFFNTNFYYLSWTAKLYAVLD